MLGWEINLDEEDLRVMQQCTAYFYQGRKIKNPTRKLNWLIAWIVVLGFVALAILAACLGYEEQFFFIGFPILWTVFVVWIVKWRQIDTLREASLYFRDETGFFYHIKITAAASMNVGGVPLSFGDDDDRWEEFERIAFCKREQLELDKKAAQNKAVAYDCVKQYKRGVREWDFWNGGSYKVTPLGQLHFIRPGLRKNHYLCDTGKRKKHVAIFKFFHVLEEGYGG